MASLLPEFLLNIAPKATDMLRRLVSPKTPSNQNCIFIKIKRLGFIQMTIIKIILYLWKMLQEFFH